MPCHAMLCYAVTSHTTHYTTLAKYLALVVSPLCLRAAGGEEEAHTCMHCIALPATVVAAAAAVVVVARLLCGVGCFPCI